MLQVSQINSQPKTSCNMAIGNHLLSLYSPNVVSWQSHMGTGTLLEKHRVFHFQATSHILKAAGRQAIRGTGWHEQITAKKQHCWALQRVSNCPATNKGLPKKHLTEGSALDSSTAQTGGHAASSNCQLGAQPNKEWIQAQSAYESAAATEGLCRTEVTSLSKSCQSRPCFARPGLL